MPIIPRIPPKLSADLRGLGSLTIEAIIGITDIVESVHSTITSFSMLHGTHDKPRTGGISGLVYRNIRTVTKIVGGGIDVLLDQLSSDPVVVESTPSREALLSVVNGVLGDHLAATNNPLAIPMRFRRNGIPLTRQELSGAIRKSGGRLVIMVHGSCMNDLQWNKDGHNHGAALASDLGIVPLYLHYNTGLHISENGHKFSDLLETIIKESAQTLEIDIIAYSMGGLVTRSACAYAKSTGQSWLNHLQKIVFLGTPHHGVPLEKGGSLIDSLLELNPYSAPFARLGKIRSCGITDMRYGNIVDDDWKGRNRFGFTGDKRVPVPLPEDVECYTIAAVRGKEPNRFNDEVYRRRTSTVNQCVRTSQKYRIQPFISRNPSVDRP